MNKLHYPCSSFINRNNMKKISFVLAFVVMIAISNGNAYAQIRKIPAEVTTSFSQRYPDAADVEWRDKLSGFNVSFTMDTVKHLASFDNDGKWQNTEQEIAQESLPEVVVDGFEKSRFADWNVTRTSKIELPGDQLQYKIEVGKGDIKKRNLYFNSNGRLLKDKMTL